MLKSHRCVVLWVACAILNALCTAASVSAQEIEIHSNGSVELHAADMPLATVLRMLSMKGNRNIIASPAARGNVTADLYGVTFEQALRAILLPLNCDFQVRDGMVYVHTFEELAPMTHRFFRLNYTRAPDVIDAIQPLLSERGTITSSPPSRAGIKASREYAGGDTFPDSDFIIVYDYPERLEIIAELIEQIDVKPLQVLIEATILRASLSEQNALGIDFSYLCGVDFIGLNATSIGVQNPVLGPLPVEQFDHTSTAIGTDFAGNVPAGGLSVGVISNNVAVFIRALEQITDTTVIANPKVLALNKQVGNVIVGRRDGYLTTTVTETTAVQQVEFLETGTQLTFRPFISTDGYVRMELHPEDSNGGLTTSELPFEETTEVTTNVLVRDGQTILIGGLFRESSREFREQVPVLGDVPVIGDAFRGRNDSIDREEVIILLTVHIIKNDADYASYSADQAEDMERARVGRRKGMMWHGRERLAQALYRKAIEEYARDQHSLALWYVGLALHNQPRHMGAIKLKEEIELRREWDEDGIITRNFVRDLIMREQGIDEPPFDRPRPPFQSYEKLDEVVEESELQPVTE
jgi:type IV pilus assembly protein PilQ